jgi:hypothetical protein
LSGLIVKPHWHHFTQYSTQICGWEVKYRYSKFANKSSLHCSWLRHLHELNDKLFTGYLVISLIWQVLSFEPFQRLFILHVHSISSPWLLFLSQGDDFNLWHFFFLTFYTTHMPTIWKFKIFFSALLWNGSNTYSTLNKEVLVNSLIKQIFVQSYLNQAQLH